MEDIVINGYTQLLLAAIGTSLVAAVGALWIILWKVIGEKDAAAEKHNERLTAVIDRYHAWALSMERTIERSAKE